MKRLLGIFLLAACFLFTGCENKAEKGRMAFDEGVDLMYHSSDFKAAEEQFSIAIKYDKDNYEAYYYRGCCKFNMKQYDDAIVDFEEALKIKEDYADAEFNLGTIYFIKGDHEMSCYYYKAAQRHGRPNLEDKVKACPD